MKHRQAPLWNMWSNETCRQSALKYVSSITIVHVFRYHRGAISRHAQIKFCVSPEPAHTFCFPVDREETVRFYWVGITPAEPWGVGSSASLGSYFLFVNGTPPGEWTVGNDGEKKARCAERWRGDSHDDNDDKEEGEDIQPFSHCLTPSTILSSLFPLVIWIKEKKIKREMNELKPLFLTLWALIVPFYPLISFEWVCSVGCMRGLLLWVQTHTLDLILILFLHTAF